LFTSTSSCSTPASYEQRFLTPYRPAAARAPLPLRYLAAGNRPSHRTGARFREENLQEFGGLFVQVVRIAQAAGLVKMGTLALDGSKLKANASKHKAMSCGRMQEAEPRLREEIERITRMAQGVDAREDQEFGNEDGQRRVRAVLQRADRRGCRGPIHRGGGCQRVCGG
jgi:hypothetical protein